MTYNYFDKDCLSTTTFALIGFVSLFFLAKVGSVLWLRKVKAVEDGALLGGYLIFITMTTLYIVGTGELYSEKYGEPSRAPWNRSRSLLVRKVFFANSLLYWCSLWSVKCAILALYRRKLVKSRTVLVLWWIVVAFCGLTLAGAIVSSFTSCHSWQAFWTIDACSSARDMRAQQASLYYGLAVDVLSDVFLLLFPIHILWKQTSTLGERLGIGALSLLGIFCIVPALLRGTADSDGTNNTNLPSSSWLAFWSVVEVAIALIIGFCPGLYVAVQQIGARSRNTALSTHQGHNRFRDQGYEKHDTKNSTYSMDDFLFHPSNPPSRITSINGEIVGISRSHSRVTSSHAIPQQPPNLPSSPPPHIHTQAQNPSDTQSLSHDFWSEVNSTHQHSRRESITIGLATSIPPPSIPPSKVPTPTIRSPAISKRNSQKSLKYTPIQIPGITHDKRDRGGCLSGAFWGDGGEGSEFERAQLEERAKKVKVQFKGTKQINMADFKL